MSTQFGRTVKAVQCDNGKEFDNSSSRTFFLTHGVHLRMSCPYTSSQNGKAERIIRSTNNIVRSLLFQASLPLASGLKHFRQLPTSLTSYPPKRSRLARRMPPSLALRLPMTISAFSGVSVILTCLLLLPTSCPPGRPSASSWVTLLIIKDTAVLTFPPTESSSPDTSFSMSPRSLMPSRAPLSHRLTLIFWILLTVCQHLSVLCISFSLQVLVLLTPHSHVRLRPALLRLVQQR